MPSTIPKITVGKMKTPGKYDGVYHNIYQYSQTETFRPRFFQPVHYLSQTPDPCTWPISAGPLPTLRGPMSLVTQRTWRCTQRRWDLKTSTAQAHYYIYLHARLARLVSCGFNPAQRWLPRKMLVRASPSKVQFQLQLFNWIHSMTTRRFYPNFWLCKSMVRN